MMYKLSTFISRSALLLLLLLLPPPTAPTVSTLSDLAT
jgi:hypothetical protein